MSKSKFLCGLLLATAALVISPGCDRNPSIRVYEVPRSQDSSSADSQQLAKAKSPSPNAPFAQGMPPGMSQQAPSGPRRFLIAVIPNEKSVIFVKGSDTPERLDGFSESLTALAKSFQFEGSSEAPTWTLPDGWTETPPTDGIAMAKFKATSSASDSQSVDFTVSQLPKPPSVTDWPDYFEQNVNRWRRQLGLPQATLSQLQSQMTEVPREGSELPAYLIDLRNESSANEFTTNTPKPETSMNQTADAAGAVPQTPPPPTISGPAIPGAMAPPDASTPRTDSKLKYDLPDGWSDEGARGMRAASFSFEGKRDSDTEPTKGEVTVIFAGGDRLANVVRWQGQLAPDKSPSDQQTADPKAAAEKAIAEAIEVSVTGGVTGQLYTLRGGDEPVSPSMLAAIIPMENGTSSVFVKLTAPTWLADQHQSRLVQFIESLKW
ncbi:MAG: hypothetical protein NTW52_04945 [Planctomycetota bacterium]|nr:hypothetical protein [Planctomycetota bacterium]